MKEHHEGQRQTKCLERARAICNLRSCYNFAFVLHENALVFSQAGARNFFMYIINRENSHLCDIFIIKKNDTEFLSQCLRVLLSTHEYKWVPLNCEGSLMICWGNP